MCLSVHLKKIEFCKYFNINFFKNKESDKMSAKCAHVQKTSEGESTNSPVLSSLCSPHIDAKYVFIIIFFSTIIILDIL